MECWWQAGRLAVVFGLTATALDCFPPGSGFTETLCCSGGGNADCWGEGYTFAGCCAGWPGSDPEKCWQRGHLYKAMCCQGAGLAGCFEPPRRTRQGCCGTRWDSDTDPLVTHMQDAVRAELWSGHLTDTGRPAFFGFFAARLNLPGPCVELGVQRGFFSHHFLHSLKKHLPAGASMPRYFMVDTWKQERNSTKYADQANVHDEEQRENMKAVADSVQSFWQHTSIIQARTDQAVRLFKDGGLRFVYVDARHDYCAVIQDLTMYWQKLSPGGIMAGHDYYFAVDDWATCEDGTKHLGGVKQAVLDFSGRHKLKVWSITHNWMMYKPQQGTG